MAEIQIRARHWLKAILATVLVIGLGYVALKNFDQWFTLINTTSTQERFNNELAKKEDKYLVPQLKQRLTDAQDTETKINEEFSKLQCDRVPTLCNRYTNSKGKIATAKEDTGKAISDLQAAQEKAKQDTDRELASVINKSTAAIGYRRYLPLLAPCLVLLGSL